MNWFIIYILGSGLYMSLAINYIVKNTITLEEKFNVSFDELNNDLKPLGLTIADLKYILPKITIICLIFGWLLLPIGIIQTIMDRLKCLK